MASGTAGAAPNYASRFEGVQKRFITGTVALADDDLRIERG